MKNIILIIVLIAVLAGGFFVLSKIFKDGQDKEAGLEVQDQTSAQGQTQNRQTAIPENAFAQLGAQILQEGDGPQAENGQKLAVHYSGFLEDGTKFDSSVDRGQPFIFTLGAGQVIQGWDSGLVGMRVNEVRRLFIPAALGYGSQAAGGGKIPADSNLVFDVQLLGIE